MKVSVCNPLLACLSLLLAIFAAPIGAAAQTPSPDTIKQWEKIAKDFSGKPEGCVPLDTGALGRARQASKSTVASRLAYVVKQTASMLSVRDREILDQVASGPGVDFVGTSLWLNRREKAAMYVLANNSAKRPHRQSVKALGLLGGFLNSLFLYEETIALLQAAVNEKKADAAVIHNLGIAYAALGDQKTALELLQQARRRAPMSGETIAAIGVLQKCAGSAKAAQATLRTAQALRWSRHDADLLENLKEELKDDSPEPPVPAPGEAVGVGRAERSGESISTSDDGSERATDGDLNSDASEVSGEQPSGDPSSRSRSSKPRTKYPRPISSPITPTFPLPSFASSGGDFLKKRADWGSQWSERISQYNALGMQLTTERMRLGDIDPSVGDVEASENLIEEQLVMLSNLYSELIARAVGGTGVGDGSWNYDDEMEALKIKSRKAAEGLMRGSLLEPLHPNHATDCSKWKSAGEGFYSRMKFLSQAGLQDALPLPNEYLTAAMRWVDMTSDPDPRVKRKRQLDVLANFYLLVAKLQSVPMSTASTWNSSWEAGYLGCGLPDSNTYLSKTPAPKADTPEDRKCPKLSAKAGSGILSVSVELTCGKMKVVADALFLRASVEENIANKGGELFFGVSASGGPELPLPAGISAFSEVEWEAGYYAATDSQGRLSDFGHVDRSNASAGVGIDAGPVKVRASAELGSKEYRTSYSEPFVDLFSSNSAATTPPPSGTPGNLAAMAGSAPR